MSEIKNNQVSTGLNTATQRLLAGHPVPMDAINQIQEIGIAKDRSERPHTDFYDDKRVNIQLNALNKIMDMGACSGSGYDNPVTQGRQLHLLLGLPASGKSTIADKLSETTGARILDSDMVKELIPEYDRGWGAAAVHDESGQILKLALKESMANGDNIILPKTGTDPDSLLQIFSDAKALGYECYAHAIELNPNKAMGRMLDRFINTGRYIPPSIAASKMGPNGENKIMQAFGAVATSDLCDGWTSWSNDVAFGQPSVLTDYSANNSPCIEKLIENADTDTSHLIGIQLETGAEAADELEDIYEAIEQDRQLAAQKSRELKQPLRQASVSYVLNKNYQGAAQEMFAKAKADQARWTAQDQNQEQKNTTDITDK